ncbi:DUF805 domain-containing protein [Methylocapsa aurea]|uniref:DUF805 domain-containing protein n=1 Tax=Methylocapsa aurea TaxID=663610 RepID=UPI000ABDFCDD|nr:DUF805 domain-containing protein [Methylocapsa aurea]
MIESPNMWHYAIGSEQKGPFSVEQLTALASAGAINANTLVWSQKLTNWEPLGRTELALLLGISPLQPPPLGFAQTFPQGAIASRDAPVTTFSQAISSCFAKYATFSGRANRPEYWWFYLFGILTSIAASVIDISSFGAHSQIQPIFSIVTLGLLLPNLAVSIRRLHDTDRSGWWLLIILIPIAGWVALIVFFCQKGSPGRNTYG